MCHYAYVEGDGGPEEVGAPGDGGVFGASGELGAFGGGREAVTRIGCECQVRMARNAAITLGLSVLAEYLPDSGVLPENWAGPVSADDCMRMLVELPTLTGTPVILTEITDDTGELLRYDNDLPRHLEAEQRLGHQDWYELVLLPGRLGVFVFPVGNALVDPPVWSAERFRVDADDEGYFHFRDLDGGAVWVAEEDHDFPLGVPLDVDLVEGRTLRFAREEPGRGAREGGADRASAALGVRRPLHWA